VEFFKLSVLFMTVLSAQDTQLLHQAIQQIYTLHDRDTFPVESLTIVDRLVPSDIPTFQRTDIRTFETEDVFMPNQFAGLTIALKQAKDRYLPDHPIAQNMGVAIHSVCAVSDFATVAELHALPIYQQFLRLLETEDQMLFFLPQDQPESLLQLTQRDPNLAGFALNRSARNFTERDRLILNLLRPHLIQAYGNAQKYQRIEQDLGQLQRSVDQLGMVILNAQGQLQWMTPKAAMWLETYFTKPTAINCLPDHLWAWVRHQIHALTQNPDGTTACMPLHIELPCKKLVIRLMPESTGDRYTLLLEEQTRSHLKLLETLGLTQRETEILGWLMQGYDNKAIATHLSINIGTVRKHLENIYRKLDVQSRSEAITYAIEKLGLLDT
jgi:DNA-binding CsgD family transcriptional regulator